MASTTSMGVPRETSYEQQRRHRKLTLKLVVLLVGQFR